MKRQVAMKAIAGIALGAIIAALTGCGAGGGGDIPEGRLVMGQDQAVFGYTVSSWARIADDNTVSEVGVIVPAGVIQSARSRQGELPPGPVCVLDFPSEVKASTFFDHFELNWEPQGHPPPGIFTVPHFDFHFYSIGAAQVQQIRPDNTALPRPDASRVPACYSVAQTDQEYLAQVVPNMGYHAIPSEAFAPGYHFTKAMIPGYYQGQMHFLEPMITQEYLFQRRNFTMDVPKPSVLGHATLYPTRLRVTYKSSRRAYEIAFTNFVVASQ